MEFFDECDKLISVLKHLSNEELLKYRNYLNSNLKLKRGRKPIPDSEPSTRTERKKLRLRKYLRKWRSEPK